MADVTFGANCKIQIGTNIPKKNYLSEGAARKIAASEFDNNLNKIRSAYILTRVNEIVHTDVDDINNIT